MCPECVRHLIPCAEGRHRVSRGHSTANPLKNLLLRPSEVQSIEIPLKYGANQSLFEHFLSEIY